MNPPGLKELAPNPYLNFGDVVLNPSGDRLKDCLNIPAQPFHLENARIERPRPQVCVDGKGKILKAQLQFKGAAERFEFAMDGD